MDYSHISDTARIVPFAFEPPIPTNKLEFGEGLLDDFTGSLVITAPAGFGKTSFCRSHAIRDANRLVVAKNTRTLPVYVALHALSTATLRSFHDAFFPSQPVRKLLELPPGQGGFDRIRLYLDGLDEVTSVQRQEELITFAEKAVRSWSSLQVIVTGRDHVTGPWLRWPPRVRLSPLSQEKVRLLASRWLESDRVETFFLRLAEAGNLQELMPTLLLATLILAVYRKTGTVPPNKTNLYATFVDLLCGGWDFYKKVQRRENYFSITDKTAVLTRLASMLQRALLAAFPAYRQHKGAEPLYDQLQKKAERLAHPNTRVSIVHTG